MIKLGIIGAGRIAKVHARSIGRTEGAILVATFDQDYGRANQLAESFGGCAFEKIEYFWESPVDAVVVCVPTFFHKKFTLDAIRAGKHVLCEKPIASNLAEAEEMIISAEKGKVRFMVGHVLRFHPAFCRIKKLLQEGYLGSIQHLHASRLSGAAQSSWEQWLLDRPEGLGVLDLTIHDLDFIHWVLGRTSSVMASGIANAQGNFLHIDTLLKFPNGTKASTEGSFLLPRQHPFQYELRILGEKGSISFAYRGTTYHDPQADMEILCYMNEKIESIEIPAMDPYEDELRYFLHCIGADKKIEIGTGEDSKVALELALAARRSSELGFPVGLQK